MTLVGRQASHRIAAGTHSALAGIGLSAQIQIVAARAVDLGRIRADSRARVTSSRIVALIERQAYDRIDSGATTRLAGVGLGTQVGIVARGVVRLGRIGTDPGAWVTNTDFVALVGGYADYRV